jgi:UPF0716 protein FxsA
MFLWLLLLFTALPVAELALLIKIGQAIEVGPTIGLVIVTGVVGAALARHQGLRTLGRIRDSTARGQMPTTELLNGLMILLAGALLITPGVITDAFGFALLIPPIRALIGKALTRYLKKRVSVTTEVNIGGFTPAVGEKFVDVEAREVSEEEPANEQDRLN